MITNSYDATRSRVFAYDGLDRLVKVATADPDTLNLDTLGVPVTPHLIGL
jgi:hypothetical protein